MTSSTSTSGCSGSSRAAATTATTACGPLTRSLGGPDYLRVRVGIGRPPGRMDPADFVLKDFSAAERKDLGVIVERAADACEALVEDGLDRAQNTYNAAP